MMHEQNHQETEIKTDSNGNQYRKLPGDMDEPKRAASREEQIEQIAKPMREHALLNFYPKHTDMNAAIKRGEFSKLVKISETVALHLIMTISPSEDPDQNPFWHCSGSIVSLGSGRPKSLMLWTSREMNNIRKILPAFFGSAGVAGTDGFIRTKTALQCHRELTPFELRMIA